jgi:hypothetical protein
MNFQKYHRKLYSKMLKCGALIEDPSNENDGPFLLSSERNDLNRTTETNNYLLLVSPDAFYKIVNLDDELEEIASDEKRPLLSIHALSSG